MTPIRGWRDLFRACLALCVAASVLSLSDANDKSNENSKANAVDELLAGMRKGSDEERLAAVARLAALGPKAAQAVETLVEGLNDKDNVVRWWSAYALGEIGPHARPVLPAIHKALKSDDLPLQTYAAIALCKIAPQECGQALPTLRTALWNDSPDLQIAAAGCIGALGPAGKEAVLDLVTVAMYCGREGLHPLFGSGRFNFPPTSDPDRSIMLLTRGEFDAVIHTTKNNSIYRAFDYRGLKHHLEVPRLAALEALGKIGPEARSARRFVWEIFQDRDPIISAAAAETLNLIAPPDSGGGRRH